MPLTWTEVDHTGAIAMLLGIIGSVSIHLSQGMMRLGIARMSSGTRFGRRLYVIGLIVNATAPL